MFRRGVPLWSPRVQGQAQGTAPTIIYRNVPKLVTVQPPTFRRLNFGVVGGYKLNLRKVLRAPPERLHYEGFGRYNLNLRKVLHALPERSPVCSLMMTLGILMA